MVVCDRDHPNQLPACELTEASCLSNLIAVRRQTWKMLRLGRATPVQPSLMPEKQPSDCICIMEERYSVHEAGQCVLLLIVLSWPAFLVQVADLKQRSWLTACVV